MGQVTHRDYIPGKDRWVDYSKYTSVRITYIGYSGAEGIPPDDLAECRLWLIDNTDSEVIIDAGTPGSLGRYITLYFASEEDLVVFKLSNWGKHSLEWIQ